MKTLSPSLWAYMSPQQQQLYRDGQLLIEDRAAHPNEQLSDYSYLVFPFSKLYEGFLKQAFRDLAVIGEQEYRSDHFRLGKVLSPNLVRRLGKNSAYAQLTKKYGTALPEQLWLTWKEGRNLVFHYFPHNVRRLSLSEALTLVDMIMRTMEELVEVTHVSSRPSH